MSREIKFRAWDKSRKRMIFPYEGDSGINVWKNEMGYLEIMQEFDDFKGLDTPFNREDFALQQYTGLKDKDHREIYEGDILSDSNGFTYRVFWYDALGSFELAKIKESPDGYPVACFGYRYLRALTVIGNEFKNPELLS